MSKLMYGSIDFSKLLELAKKGDKSFSKASNGKLYVNINVWLNDEKDQFGNDASIQTSFKDAPKEEKHYFGNLKFSDYNGSTAISNNDIADIPEEGDLPF